MRWYDWIGLVVGFGVLILVSRVTLANIEERVHKKLETLREKFVELRHTVNEMLYQAPPPARYMLVILAEAMTSETILDPETGKWKTTKERNTVYNFGRIGDLKPGETREEMFSPYVNITGGQFFLVAPDDIHIEEVQGGNISQVIGSSQLMLGRIPPCNPAQRLKFTIRRLPTV